MNKISGRIHRLGESARGISTLECALLISLIAVVIIPSATWLGEASSLVFNEAAEAAGGSEGTD